MQDGEEVRRQAEAFLKVHASSLPGTTTFSVGKVEPSPTRPPCGKFSTVFASGAKTYGKTTLKISCEDTQRWVMYVPVQIDVQVTYLVSGNLLGQGQVVVESDLQEKTGNLADLPNGTVTDKAQAIGLVAAVPITPGQTLRAGMLRAPYVVQVGQPVRVLSRGDGFEVSNEGRALASAASGQQVQVKLNTGQVLTGVARSDGLVEVVLR